MLPDILSNLAILNNPAIVVVAVLVVLVLLLVVAQWARWR